MICFDIKSSVIDIIWWKICTNEKCTAKYKMQYVSGLSLDVCILWNDVNIETFKINLNIVVNDACCTSYQIVVCSNFENRLTWNENQLNWIPVYEPTHIALHKAINSGIKQNRIFLHRCWCEKSLVVFDSFKFPLWNWNLKMRWREKGKFWKDKKKIAFRPRFVTNKRPIEIFATVDSSNILSTIC